MDINTPEFIARHRAQQLKVSDALRNGFDENQASRRARIRQMAPTDTKDGTVLLMIVNQGHLSLFQNWFKSCELNHIDPRTWSVVIALDEESYEAVRSLGFTGYFDPDSYGTYENSAVAHYGDTGFGLIMFPKTAVVQDFLDLGYNVLFQDVDMIWRKDPRGFLLHSGRRHLDAQFMYDGPNQYFQPLYANTGFFLLRNTTKSRALWGKVFDEYDKILWYRSQQRAVNIVLLNHFFRGLKLSILAEEEFANGHLFSIESLEKLPPNPAVIHCSWTANLAHKIEKLQFAGLWYL